MKKLGLATVALSVLLLSGCGGSKKKSVTDEISSRKYVEILRYIPVNNRCEEADFKQYVINETHATNLFVAEVDITASCATYKKVENQNCLIEYYTDADKGNTSCVLAYDSSIYDAKLNKSVTTSALNIPKSLIAE